jgi:RNA polymerase sigma-70 factor (ECF subfamily)
MVIRTPVGNRSRGRWDDGRVRTVKLVSGDLNAAGIRIQGGGLVREELVSDDDRSDAALIDAARRGSEAALAALFHRHWPVAERAAYLVCHDRDGAEDIAQEAFLAAVRSLDRFDRRRPFAPWLHRIVVNRAIDFTRTRAARRERIAADVPEPPHRQTDEPDTDVLAALVLLDPDHRAVIVMRYVLDLSPGEIARALELPRGTVNSRLRRGLDALGDRLDREQERVR